MPSPGVAAQRPHAPGGERSLFWGVVPLRAAADREAIELGVAATLADGRTMELVVADPRPALRTEPVEAPAAGPGTVAICMATFEPDPQLFERQIESLRAQTHRDWICLISDDASSAEAFARIESATASDSRFLVNRAPVRAGAYENFGRAMSMVPVAAGWVALCDQDDEWRPEKLSKLIAALGEARLAFSDMRVTRADGSVLSETYWTHRRPNHRNFASLLLGNSVTGAASLFRRDLLDDALPLPPRCGNLYHDHWLALVAAATGEIAYVDEPLYDYVQHERAVIGHAGANRGVVGGSFPRRLLALRGRAPGRLRTEWRRLYFGEYCRMALSGVALQMRLGNRIEPGRRRAITRLLAADRSVAAAGRLAARQLRRPFHDDTGGSEAGMLRGLAWRRLVSRSDGRDPLDDADLPEEFR
jgi:glycosyltransferase involved in cell wall biosynthesis